MKSVDHMSREEPEAKVDPRYDHAPVEEGLDGEGCHINGHFEEGDCQVGDVVKDHDGGTDGQHVQRVGKEDQGPSHQVMEHVLWEI